MKFSVASSIAFVAFFSQALAKVHHCASFIVLYRSGIKLITHIPGGGPYVRMGYVMAMKNFNLTSFFPVYSRT
jgi:hypothetical protein